MSARKIEPQAQVIYSYLDQENHTDRDGVRITTLDNDGLFGRLGVKSSYFEQKDVKAAAVRCRELAERRRSERSGV